MAGNEKKPFVLRLTPEMMKAMQKWADDDFRSLNAQIEFLLHTALINSKRLKKK
ncbi:MAG: Arc family DNA binding domain-containing protein [Bacteroidota bacterium]|jgi:hypothetical protein